MEIDAIEPRLKSLHESLTTFGPNDACPWGLGVIFNALLDEAKKALPDDPIVAAIEPAQAGSSERYATANCGALAGSTLQLWRALSRD